MKIVDQREHDFRIVLYLKSIGNIKKMEDLVEAIAQRVNNLTKELIDESGLNNVAFLVEDDRDTEREPT